MKTGISRTDFLLQCEKCQGKGFTFEGEVREACTCILEWKIRVCLRTLGPREHPGADAMAQIQALEHNQSVFLRTHLSNPSKINGITALAILQVWRFLGRRPTFKYKGTYELIMDWLGDDAPMSMAKDDLLILYHRPNQPANKHQAAVIMQHLDWRSGRGLPSWFILCANTTLPEGLTEAYFTDSSFLSLSIQSEGSSQSTAKTSETKAPKGVEWDDCEATPGGS